MRRAVPGDGMTIQANIDTLVTVFGGSGFLGRHVVRALAKRHYRIRVAVRRPELAGHLQPLGRVGQIHPVQANLRHAGSIAAAVRGAEAVARAAAAGGARMIHVSAIGAGENSTSAYARSKAAGEKAVLAAAPAANIFRPSIVFGPDDSFFNRFASIARFSPALPLIGGGQTRFQPVFAGDVAAAIAAAVEGETRPGATYELGGPEIFTFRELMDYILKTIERRRVLLPLPFWLAKFQATFLQYLPKPLLTPDQVELLRTDNVVSPQAIDVQRTLQALGIETRLVQAIVPSYLWRFRRTGQFKTARHG